MQLTDSDANISGKFLLYSSIPSNSTEICHKLNIHFKDEDQSDLITQALPECHSYTDKKAVCFNEV